MITVVGLGLSADSLSVKGQKKIKSADIVAVRSTRTPPSKGIKADVSFDSLFDKAKDFDELNRMIADELCRLDRDKDIVYCVDGDGFKDSSVIELSKRTEIEIIAAPFDLPLPPATSILYMSAYDGSLYPDPLAGICVYNIDDAMIAGEVKLFLMRFYDFDRQVLLMTGKSKRYILLEELDRQKKYSFDTAVYVEGGNNSSFADLLRIMARLTAVNGCPWDKAQTHESIRINLLEEAYETVQAITDGNIDGEIEELGDVLLQVVFHCDIALRSGEYTLEDVIKGLNDKLIGRHTHIFGGDSADSADGALNVWERNKMKEKGQSTFSQSVKDIPEVFPALLRAQKAIKRTQKGGWGARTVDELSRELGKNLNIIIGCKDEKTLIDAIGEALMNLVALGQKCGVNCEQALLDKVSALQKRYVAFEQAILSDGRDVDDLSENEREEYKRRIDNV